MLGEKLKVEELKSDVILEIESDSLLRHMLLKLRGWI